MRLLVLAALLLGAPAHAQSGSAILDPRIREVEYAPGTVYRVPGALRTATQIIFDPNETIQHAAVGDSQAWEVVAEGSVLFLKPRERHLATNLLVVTARNGEPRHYAFELGAREARDRNQTAFQIRFRYPEDERRQAEAALATITEAAQDKLINLQLQAGVLEGPRNLQWAAQGDPTLQPQEVSDNGRFTVLRFAAGQGLPTLYEVGEDGSERLVAFDVRGDLVVLHSVPRALRLRRGRAVLCLYNLAPAAVASTATGTATTAVERLPAETNP